MTSPYTYEEVYDKALQYFNGNELAANVWVSKYALKDSEDKYYELTPQDMFHRLTKELSRIEDSYGNPEHPELSEYGKKRNHLTYDKIYELLDDFKKIIPQGSIMSSLANPYAISSLSNCVVFDSPHDSYGGILYTDQQLAQAYKRRMGAGINISTLRPKGMGVKNAALTTSGAVSFMERFSNTTREVGQGGRRGALMEIMDCRHPDIEDFITIKLDNKKVTGANISVIWHDEFMEAVKNNTEYILRWPVDASVDDAQVTKTVNARDIWMKAINSAHKSAEPGMAFIDTIRKYSTCNNYYNISCSNPCGEIFMGGHNNTDSCRLIAINMFHAVKNPYTKDAYFDFEEWYKTVYESMRLMDDIVDLELEAISKILEKIQNDPEPDHIKAVELQTWQDLYKSGKDGRRVGLGFTSLGDVIASLNLKYDESQQLIDKIMRTKLQGEFDSSIDMAIQRGAFPIFDVDKENNSFTQMLIEEFPDIWERMIKHGRKSISLSTIAPSGSLSLLAKLVNRYGTSSGIEPVFATSHTRRKKINPGDKNARVDFTDEMGDSWTEFEVYHSGLLEWAEINNTDPTSENSPYYNSTANDIDWLKRVEIQSICQKYITHSISSTINLPKDVSVETVAEIYEKAWEMGLKGITIYVDGSRNGVLITENKKDSNRVHVKRPKEILANVHNVKINGDKWTLLVGMLNDKPYELFALKYPHVIKSKVGKIVKVKAKVYNLICDTETIEDITAYNTDEEGALSRLISLYLRSELPLFFLTDQLSKSQTSIVSFSKAVNRVLAKYTNETNLKCEDCGSKNLVSSSGCFVCVQCGSSKCG